MSNNNNYGQIIRATRRAKDITQEQLAEASGITVASICQIEKGQHLPSLRVLERIAQPLGLELRLVDAGKAADADGLMAGLREYMQGLAR